MRKGIVIGSGDTALGVIRAMAEKDIEVVHLSTESRDQARFSRFISERINIPLQSGRSEELLELLMSRRHTWHDALLVPTSDEAVIFVAQHRDRLASHYHFAVQELSLVEKIMNKRLLYLKAQEVGVPIPETFFPDSAESLRKIHNTITYPCILKPIHSHEFKKVYEKKVLVVHDSEELFKEYQEAENRNLDVILSEIVPGDDSCFFHYRSYIDSQGQVLAEMCTQKIRQHPPRFGVARVSKTTPMIHEIKDLSLKLLRSLSYHGMSSIEFKFDSRDKKYKLMEINVRPVIPERLFVAAGMNFVYVSFLDLVRDVRRPVPGYEPDIYWIHNFFEAEQLPKGLMSNRLNVSDCVRPYMKKKVFCVPFFDDPLPFIVESGKLMGLISKKLLVFTGSRWLERDKEHAHRR